MVWYCDADGGVYSRDVSLLFSPERPIDQLRVNMDLGRVLAISAMRNTFGIYQESMAYTFGELCCELVFRFDTPKSVGQFSQIVGLMENRLPAEAMQFGEELAGQVPDIAGSVMEAFREITEG